MNLRHGVVLQGVDPPSELKARVREIEEMGYDHLWLTDSSLHARNVYAYLTLAAIASKRLTLGTAVTNPLTRHPGITAAAIATVDEISGGRAVLGIGAGDRPLRALGLRPATLDSVRAAVEMIRSLLRGERVDLKTPVFSASDAHLRFETRADVPIFISASGPRSLRLAGEIADGVILLVGLFPEAIEWAARAIQEGADVGRRARPHIAVFAYGSIDEDEERALTAASTIAAWFPQTAPHICELAGLPVGFVREVRSRYAGGEFQEAAEAASVLPSEFIRKVALSGSRARTRDQLRDAFSAGADSVHVFPLGGDRMTTIRAFLECLPSPGRST